MVTGWCLSQGDSSEESLKVYILVIIIKSWSATLGLHGQSRKDLYIWILPQAQDWPLYVGYGINHDALQEIRSVTSVEDK